MYYMFIYVFSFFCSFFFFFEFWTLGDLWFIWSEIEKGLVGLFKFVRFMKFWGWVFGW